MGNAKVIFGNETLIDLTGDTVSANNLLSGATAHDRSGTAIQGAVTVPSALDDLTDVDITSPTTDQVLKFDGSKWVNGNGGGGASALDDLTDVDITTPTDGQVLTYDANTQTWVNGNGGGGGGGFVLADWLTAGGLNPMSYADLAAVLADEKAVRKLMTIHLAVDYLAGQTAVDASINTILTDNTCAKWITLRDYALDTLDKEYRSLMEEIGKYYYGEWALMPQVPKMASNTTPYGEAYSNRTLNSNYPAYKCFNGQTGLDDFTTGATSSGDLSTLIVGYKFINPVCVKSVGVQKKLPQTAWDRFVVKASNDGTNWTTLTNEYTNESGDLEIYDVPNNDFYLYYGITVRDADATRTDDYFDTKTLQFYTWAPKGNVPIMTSDTAPYGEASASSSDSNCPPYYAFSEVNGRWATPIGTSTGWLQYKFTNPVCIKSFMFISDSAGVPEEFTLQGSNDGTTFTNIQSYTNSIFEKTMHKYQVTNDDYYMVYRLNITKSYRGTGSSDYARIIRLQFYGRALKVSVPVMTSNTAPYGVASASGEYSTRYAWKAFDGTEVDSNDQWNVRADTGWIAYEFPSNVCLKMVAIKPSGSLSGSRIKDFEVQASNDNFTTYDTLYSDTIVNENNNPTVHYYNLTNTAGYKKCRIYCNGHYDADTIGMFLLQFYGFDYSEYDWDAGNPRHYLYDHGVELETLSTRLGQNAGNNVTKEPGQIYTRNGTINTSERTYAKVLCNVSMSSYNLARCIIGNKLYSPLNAGFNMIVISSDSAYPSGGTEDMSYRVAQANVKDGDAGLPNTKIALDISGVSDSWIAIGCDYYANYYAGVTEWWLE